MASSNSFSKETQMYKMYGYAVKEMMSLEIAGAAVPKAWAPHYTMVQHPTPRARPKESVEKKHDSS